MIDELTAQKLVERGSLATGNCEELWSSIKTLAETESLREIDVVLNEFFEGGCLLDRSKLVGMHHIAFYIGEYNLLEDIYRLSDYFTKIESETELNKFHFGPSYIAPKYYGTPGWWFSLYRGQKGALELFCCLEFGNWKTFETQKKTRLMSHYALRATGDNVVEELLHQACQMDEIELIAFTKRDELGHTYGHLRNRKTCKVLEIVSESDLAEYSKDMMRI